MSTIELAYQSPFDWDSLIGFLRHRAVPGTEAVIDGRFVRSVRICGLVGWLSVEHQPERESLSLWHSPSLEPARAQLAPAVRRQFDLDCDPQAVAAVLGSLAHAHPGLRVPGAIDGFEQAVRAILGQQISVAAATTLAGRIARHFGDPIETPYAGVERVFPSPLRVAALTQDQLGVLGIIGTRARSIIALAAAAAASGLRLDDEAEVESTLERLRALPGIGEWTAHYIALRCLAWHDAFLHTDLVIKRAFPGLGPREILAAGEAWRPYRGYATLQLWKQSVAPIKGSVNT